MKKFNYLELTVSVVGETEVEVSNRLSGKTRTRGGLGSIRSDRYGSIVPSWNAEDMEQRKRLTRPGRTQEIGKRRRRRKGRRDRRASSNRYCKDRRRMIPGFEENLYQYLKRLIPGFEENDTIC